MSVFLALYSRRYCFQFFLFHLLSQRKQEATFSIFYHDHHHLPKILSQEGSTKMSEFPLSSPSPSKTQFSSLLLSDFFLFCSFISSHPLYFFYFVFFSPYLLKFLSFLSPLFITTSLLLLALLTFSPNLVNDIFHSQLSGTYQALVERLRPKVDSGDEDFYEFDGLEAYKIVFDTSILEIEETPVGISGMSAEENSPEGGQEAEVQESAFTHECPVVQGHKAINGNLVENSVEIKLPESVQLIAEDQKKTLLGGFLHKKEEKEEVKEVKPLSVKTNKGEEKKEEPAMRNGSKAIGNKTRELAKVSGDDGGDKYHTPKHGSPAKEETFWSPDHGGEYNSSKVSNLRSFGSMRKEKEWRRTLACKLFEERHNADGGEGMDLLWETYETDSLKVQAAKSKSKKWKKGSSFGYYDHEEEEEEEEGDDGNLCCLQALKFSAGKMNLGMGRPSLVKISKALKGMGWLHHVNRSGRKGYH